MERKIKRIIFTLSFKRIQNYLHLPIRITFYVAHFRIIYENGSLKYRINMIEFMKMQILDIQLCAKFENTFFKRLNSL